MRTALNLPDKLVEEAEQRARETGKTLTILVIDGLRRVLQEDDADPDCSVLLPTFGNPDNLPLIDITDRDALFAALDADGYGQ